MKVKRLNKKAAGSLNKEQENYLDKIPVHNGDFDWMENNGLVTVIQKNDHLYDRLAQKFLKTPKESQIDLDKFGSFVWLQIDGKRSIYDIGILVKAEFGKEAEPLYERLSKYFYTLNDVKFIKLEDSRSDT